MGRMSEPGSTRPRQVTMAVWLACGASLALIINAASTMADLNSLQMRERLQAGFDEAGVDLDPAAALPWLQVAIYVAGVVAAITFVSAIYVGKRDPKARILVTIGAVLVFLSGIFIDPILAAMVAVSATLLWSGQANDWFAGRPPQPSPQTAALATTPASRTQSTEERPPPAYRPPSADLSEVFAADGIAAAGAQMAVLSPRPRQVTLAGLLTVVLSSAVAFWLFGAAVAAASDVNGELRKRFDADPRFAEAGLDYATVKAMVVALMGAVGVWALVAVVLGVLLLRGVSWSRIALLISASVAGAAAVLAGLAFWGFFLIAAACVAVIRLIAGPPASTWFNQRRGSARIQPRA